MPSIALHWIFIEVKNKCKSFICSSNTQIYSRFDILLPGLGRGLDIMYFLTCAILCSLNIICYLICTEFDCKKLKSLGFCLPALESTQVICKKNNTLTYNGQKQKKTSTFFHSKGRKTNFKARFGSLHWDLFFLFFFFFVR